MTGVLIDTHVFLWWVSWSARIKDEWTTLMTDSANTVYLSAASAWEIETKRRINKLDFEDDVAAIGEKFGFEELAVSISDAALAGSMDWDHRDPFDRVLVAQAIRAGLVILSADEAMRSAPGVRVL